jgi:hypothetical protein
LVGFKKTFDAINAWSANRQTVPITLAKGRKALNQSAAGSGFDLLSHYARFEATVVRMEQAIAERVLSAHIRGYSTTWHDFFHDLIP